ncbi:MAG TPA: hypothetical protein QF772_06035, partial [Nitrospinaceae bacterium]|nr:hypothetical protein [Nitrospinaceae bacterium]
RFGRRSGFHLLRTGGMELNRRQKLFLYNDTPPITVTEKTMVSAKVKVLAETVQSRPSTSIFKHATAGARNSTTKWYITRELDKAKHVSWLTSSYDE